METAVSFLFDYYKFQLTEAKSHFDQDLEIDKWFKCRNGWSIGISCKRTLRECWKQVSQADRSTLSHFKIKELWHIITYDKDLSDDKIVRLGEQGQIFYLMDIKAECDVSVQDLPDRMESHQFEYFCAELLRKTVSMMKKLPRFRRSGG